MKKLTLILIIITFTSLCNSKPSLEVPEISNDGENRECISGLGLWETEYGCFAFVAGDNLNLRFSPSIKSKIIKKLPITRRIHVLYVKKQFVEIGNLKGRWAFVQDGTNSQIKGWVFDYYVAFKSKFKKVKNWSIKKIEVLVVHTTNRFTCTAEGNFTNSWFSSFVDVDGSSRKGFYSGKIYQYKNIIWFKKDKPDDFITIFYFNKKNELKLQDYHADLGYIKTY